MSGTTLYYMYCADQQAPCVWQMSVCCDERISFIYHSSSYLFIHPSFYHTYSSDVIMGVMIIHQSTPYHHHYHYLPHILSYHHHSIEERGGKGRVSKGFDRWMDRCMDGQMDRSMDVSTSSSAEVLPSFHVIHDDNRHLYAVSTQLDYYYYSSKLVLVSTLFKIYQTLHLL